MAGEFDKEPRPEFEIGDSVIVTGDVCHSGESGIVFGFFRRSTQTLYAVKFANDFVVDLPSRNLQANVKARHAGSA